MRYLLSKKVVRSRDLFADDGLVVATMAHAKLEDKKLKQLKIDKTNIESESKILVDKKNVLLKQKNGLLNCRLVVKNCLETWLKNKIAKIDNLLADLENKLKENDAQLWHINYEFYKAEDGGMD
jgi:hypothetical protein